MHKLLDSSVQDTVHQAVDVAFSVADLIGNLFGDVVYKRTLISSSADQSAMQFFLDPTNNYQPTFENTSATSWGVIHASQATQSPLGDNNSIPLASDVYYVQPNTKVPFDKYTNYQRGLLTATMVNPDPSQQLPIPLAAVTGCDMTPCGGISLGSTALFNIDGTGITYQNRDTNTNNVHLPSFTVSSSAPNRTFVLGATVQAGQTLRIPFPEDVSGTAFKQVNAVLSGPVSAFPPNQPGWAGK